MNDLNADGSGAYNVLAEDVDYVAQDGTTDEDGLPLTQIYSEMSGATAVARLTAIGGDYETFRTHYGNMVK